MLTVAGAVAHITRCVEVEVTLANVKNGTQEVPVSLTAEVDHEATLAKANARANLPPPPSPRIRYADPLTWVLKPFPSVVPCSTLTPIKWKIGLKWVCASPHTTPCEAPSQLQIKSTRFQMDPFADALDGSLYTAEQQQAHRDFVTLQQSREAVSYRVTKDSLVNQHDGTLGNPLSLSDVEGLTQHVALLNNPYFGSWGATWNTLCGFLMILALVRGVCEIAMLVAQEVAVRGVGWWIPWVILQGIFVVSAIPIRIAHRTIRDLIYWLAQNREREAQRRGPPGGPLPIAGPRRPGDDDGADDDAGGAPGNPGPQGPPRPPPPPPSPSTGHRRLPWPKTQAGPPKSPSLKRAGAMYQDLRTQVRNLSGRLSPNPRRAAPGSTSVGNAGPAPSASAPPANSQQPPWPSTDRDEPPNSTSTPRFIITGAAPQSQSQTQPPQ